MDQDEHRDELLKHYSERDPKHFIQIDAYCAGHFEPEPDYIMAPDAAGDCLTSQETFELMHGAGGARVLIDPLIPPGDIARLLRKVASWIDEKHPLVTEVPLVTEESALTIWDHLHGKTDTLPRFVKRWDTDYAVHHDKPGYGRAMYVRQPRPCPEEIGYAFDDEEEVRLGDGEVEVQR